MEQNKSSRCAVLLGIYFQILLILSYKSTKLLALDSNTDRESLLAFKSSVLDSRNALSGWNRSVSHCVWAGVSCSGSGSRVASLNLPSLGLSGTISPHLSNLTSLKKLNFFNNSFYGGIPANFANLSLVRTIILARNSITGKIPPELGNLHSLRNLDVSVNNLTGEIPRSYGNLSSLTTLELAMNRISGELWDELRALRNLVKVQISQNILTGELPSWLFNISSLQYISLAKNNLVRKLPSERDGVNITNLRELYLGGNRIGGTIPSFLFESSKIQSVDLSTNQFEGRIPIPHKMKELTLLHLGHNHLSSTKEINAQFFDSLMNSTKLEILQMDSNVLSGELPGSIGNLSLRLQHLCLNDNFFTGNFPDGFERYKNLAAISIFQNSFSGNFPISIGKALKLQRVQAGENNFSGEIPESLGNLTLLFMLTLGKNQFSGRIPASISGCWQMTTLVLASNELSGNVPNEIFRLPNLRILSLGNNKLDGPIPSEVGSLKQLEILDMGGNYLSGSIPSIGESSSIRSLNLSLNNLGGQLPDSIGKSLGLDSLDLSHNNITGTIPANLGNLMTLRTLNLSFNDLEGEVPQNGVFVNLTWEALKGNGNLCASNQEVSQTLRISMCSVAKKSMKKHHLLAILIPVSISIILLVCATVGVIWVLIKSTGRKEAHPSPLVKGLPMMISYEEIRRATSNFSAENLIGKGGFGSLYRGTLASRLPADASATPRTYHTGSPGSGTSIITLAVKVIDLSKSKASKSFIAECEALKRVRHRNLVKVITSCSSVDHIGAEFKALVMEFMSNGNLDRWLYPEAGEYDRLNLGLMQRVSIATDVASALEYLHSDCDPPIIHCDLKPGNVLLDEHLTARVGDFGLARFLSSRDQQEVIESSTVGLKGSIGYMAPGTISDHSISVYGKLDSFRHKFLFYVHRIWNGRNSFHQWRCVQLRNPPAGALHSQKAHRRDVPGRSELDHLRSHNERESRTNPPDRRPKAHFELRDMLNREGRQF